MRMRRFAQKRIRSPHIETPSYLLSIGDIVSAIILAPKLYTNNNLSVMIHDRRGLRAFDYLPGLKSRLYTSNLGPVEILPKP